MTDHADAGANDALREGERAAPDSARNIPTHREPSTAARATADDEALAEFLPDPYLVTDVYGAIRSANHAAAEMFGASRHALIGRPMAVFVPLEWRAQFRSGLAALLRSGDREEWRTTLHAAEGEVPVRLTVAVRRRDEGGAAGVRWLVQRDNGASAAGGAATQAPAFERTTVASTPSGITGRSAWLLSQAGSILSSSFDYELNLRSALELTVPWLSDWAMIDLLSESAGIRRLAVARASTEERALAAVLARRLPSLGDPRDPIARVLCGGPAELIADVTRHDAGTLVSTSWGRELVERLAPRSWITVPLRARGRTIGALTFLTARSQRPLGPAQLVIAQQLADRAAMAADNARLYGEAMRASEAKSAFLAVMSHELRTPLTAIIGYTELLADGLFGPVTSDQRVQLGRVRESSEHLLHIVEQVLHYARLDARHEEPELHEVDITSLLDQVSTIVRPLADRKKIALLIERPAERTVWRSDEGRLRQILVNLLANAVKFTERGEVRLVASIRDELVMFEVHDTGPGIPPELLARIFEPFWQADQRFTRQQPGSGLGLSVTKELVSLLRGGIDVRSTVGAGSTFTVWFPRQAHGAEGDAAMARGNGNSPATAEDS